MLYFDIFIMLMFLGFAIHSYFKPFKEIEQSEQINQNIQQYDLEKINNFIRKFAILRIILMLITITLYFFLYPNFPLVKTNFIIMFLTIYPIWYIYNKKKFIKKEYLDSYIKPNQIYNGLIIGVFLFLAFIFLIMLLFYFISEY